MVNFVTQSRRKDSCYAGAKMWQAVKWRCCEITPTSPVARPEESDSLQAWLNVNRMGLGNPDESRRVSIESGGILTAKEGDDSAGKGGWRKRMPRCNGADRATVLAVGIPTSKEGRLPAGFDGRETLGAEPPAGMLGDGSNH